MNCCIGLNMCCLQTEIISIHINQDISSKVWMDWKYHYAKCVTSINIQSPYQSLIKSYELWICVTIVLNVMVFNKVEIKQTKSSNPIYNIKIQQYILSNYISSHLEFVGQTHAKQDKSYCHLFTNATCCSPTLWTINPYVPILYQCSTMNA